MPTINFGFPRTEARKLINELNAQILWITGSELPVIYYLRGKCYLYCGFQNKAKSDLNLALQNLKSQDEVFKISEIDINNISLNNEIDTIYGLGIKDISLMLDLYKLQYNIKAMLHLMRSALFAKQRKFDEALADINAVDLNDFEMSDEKEQIANIYMQALENIFEYIPWKFYTYFLNPECPNSFFKKANELFGNLEIYNISRGLDKEICKYFRFLSETDEIQMLKHESFLLKILECEDLALAGPNISIAFELHREKIKDFIDKIIFVKAKRYLSNKLYLGLIESRDAASTCSYKTILTTLYRLAHSAVAAALPANVPGKPIDFNATSHPSVIQVEDFIPAALPSMRF
jgi:hypothetical protein